MLNHDAFPDGVSTGESVTISADIVKQVLILAKKAEIDDLGIGIPTGPVLDKKMAPIKRFFENDNGELLDNEEYVAAGFPASIPILRDPDDPNKIMTIEELSKQYPWVAFWHESIVNYNKEFATACLDNESMHPFLPTDRDLSEYIRSPYMDTTKLDDSTEALGYWCHLPQGMKELLKMVAEIDISYESLGGFWSQTLIPGLNWSSKEFNVDIYKSIRRNIAAGYVVAADYMLKDKNIEAVYLLFYAALLDECIERGPDYVRGFFTANPTPTIETMSAGFFSFQKTVENTRTRSAMLAFLKTMVHYMHDDAVKLLGTLLSKMDDIDTTEKSTAELHSLMQVPFDHSTRMNIILANGCGRIGTQRIFYCNTTLGWVVKIHTIKRHCIANMTNEASKLFRIIHNEKTIFLSSSGKETLLKLGIRNGDEVTIGNIQQRSDPHRSQMENAKHGTKALSEKKNTSKTKAKKAKKAKKKRMKIPPPPLSEEEIIEKDRQIHSQVLSYVFDELRPQLKEIRKRLNELSIQKSSPEVKGRKRREKKMSPDATPMVSDDKCLGGKAGKIVHPVLVGEPTNLYKPMKPTSLPSIAIDLHGCTEMEAVTKLETILPVWVDKAMKGDFPFVIAADIICGGGNQILSEAVSRWVRNTNQVANRPKRTH